MSTYVCTLSPELQKRAKDELGEDPARRADDIEAIRTWLKKQPHINARMDDWSILRFLRGCKFSLEKTKEKLDMFYTCKTAVPEWYTNRDPRDPKMREILELGLLLPLPHKNPESPFILLGRWGLYSPNKVSMDDIMHLATTFMDILQADEEVLSVAGFSLLNDCRGQNLSHAASFTPTIMKKSIILMQEGYPMRPKGLHYINTPQAFDTVFSIFKSFMKEKMKKRVHIHGSNLESLHEHIPKEVLPVEYGGTNGTVEEITKYWLKRVDERRDWLMEDEKYKVDESKRPGKPKTTVDLFGLDGSFRKLNID